jgi:hypothetical protein
VWAARYADAARAAARGGKVWGTSVGVLVHSRTLTLLSSASADLTEVNTTSVD